MQVLVTGANGFVGTELCKTLLSSGAHVHAAVRSHEKLRSLPSDVEPVLLESLSDLTPVERIASKLDCIVHLAARVHQVKETSTEPLAAFRQINVDATTALATIAARHRVKRFVFLSSVKVHGEGQGFGEAQGTYTERDTPVPEDPYGVSKWEAEQALWRIAAQTGLETVILRPTLMYGPVVKANFLQLMRLVDAGLPMPLSRVNNSRSLLYVGNLVSSIQACMHHDQAKGQTFLVSDGNDLSTPELIRALAAALGRPSRLFPVAPAWIARLGQVTGKSSAVRRLLGSLKVDSGKICKTLGWQPPFTVDEGLRATAVWYQDQLRSRQLARRVA